VEDTELVGQELHCPIQPFPLRYLGLPLGLRKPTASQLQFLVDSVANRLPGWRAMLLNRGGRLELVRSTLSAMPIFAMMSLDIPVKTLTCIQKIIRGFLWKGRKDVHGGHCLVAWDQACMPKELGGLGIPNLRLLNLALRARWLWLSRVEAAKPWIEFNIQVPQVVHQLFDAATSSLVGDGRSTLFWTDNWLGAGRIKDMAPNLFAHISRRVANTRTVHDGLAGLWLEDITPDLDALEISELLQVADWTAGFELTEGVDDVFRWNWGGSGVYSAASCYRAFFAGSIEMAGALQVWRSRAPAKCKFFLWLAVRNRCWTADRLSRRGLPHPAACPFCDQVGETIDHLLVGCVFARIVWSRCLGWWGRPDRAPDQGDHLVDWMLDWQGSKEEVRDIWTGLGLVIWCLWRHRNDIVFEGATPSTDVVTAEILREAELWRAARLFRASLATVDRWMVRE
jgi:hypothetical protein